MRADLHKVIKGQRSFANTPKGFSELLAWVSKRIKDASIAESYVMEATGVYHEQLAYFLKRAGKTVHIVLPLKSKRYLQSLGHRSKTDELDAKGLAFMGCEQELEKWESADVAMVELRSITRQIEALKNHRTSLLNQIEAATHAMHTHILVMKSLKKLLKSVDKEIAILEQQIANLVAEHEELHKQYEHVKSLKGVGLMTFAVVAAETSGFALFKNQRQLVCYSGYDIVENQSGQKRGKTSISKKGNTHIRRILHMASLGVIKGKVAPFKALYERVYKRTGIKMKGYVAVQRKLLLMLYTLWKKDEDFIENYQEPTKSDDATKQKKQEVTSGNQEAKPSLSVAPKGAKKQPLLEEMAALDEPPLNQSAEALFR